VAAQDLLGTHEFFDERRNLHAFITIDDLTLGPALGGIRMHPYRDLDEARADCEQLAQAMKFKNAVARVAHGGGKMVVVGNPQTDKNEALYRFVASCINSLGGAYIAACDVGWNPPDLVALRELSAYVAGLPREGGCGDDTAEMTAIGVIAGIQAVLEYACNTRDPHNFYFTLQGVGNVGRRAGIHLYRSGGLLYFCDTLPEKTQQFKRVCMRATAFCVASENIYDESADIFVPCARGGILTEETIKRLAKSNVFAVAGSANNQLAEPKAQHAALLHERGILYAPDFVINAGGVMYCAAQNAGNYNEQRTRERVLEIGPRLLDIFKRAAAADCSPYFLALENAECILAEARAKNAATHVLHTLPVTPA